MGFSPKTQDELNREKTNGEKNNYRLHRKFFGEKCEICRQSSKTMHTELDPRKEPGDKISTNQNSESEDTRKGKDDVTNMTLPAKKSNIRFPKSQVKDGDQPSSSNDSSAENEDNIVTLVPKRL